jgi:phosphomannomutase
MVAENGSLIASHSGVRGRPGAGLDGEVVEEIVARWLSLVSERELPMTLGVARDARPTSEALAALVTESTTRRGADVLDFGRVSTPTAKLAARRRGLGGAVVVTGSHLGSEWNGLKLVAGPAYWPLDVRGLQSTAAMEGAAPGSVVRDRDAERQHAAAVCESVDADAVRRAKLRVSLRGGCGQAAQLALEQLGCTLVADGADVGLLMDQDGDRLRLIDERSNPLDPDATLPLVAIARGARRIVQGADTSRIAEVLAKRWRWSVRVTSPGELHLLEELARWDADVAGEGNGGVVVRSVGMARDALAAAASVLALVARGKPLSRLAAELPRLVRRRESVPCAGAEAVAALAGLAERTGARVVDPEEGVVLERPGEGWALIRQSATEPVLRITVESPDEGLTEELLAEVRAALPVAA